MDLKPSFRAADLIVFLISVSVCLVIGVIFAILERKRNTVANYFLANRKYKTLPVAISMVATFCSSLSMIGFPAEAYAYGIGIACYAIGTLCSYSFNAIFIVPVFHPLKLTSVYGYFQLRYGDNVLRYITLSVGIIYNLFYMAIITFGTSIAVEVVIGIPFWGTFLIFTILTSIYTSVGGIKAVIWTDVFQTCVIIIGIFAVLIKSITAAGGTTKLLEYSYDHLQINFRFDPTIRFQFWNVSFGSFSTILYLCFTQQAMQRVFVTPSVKAARCMYFVSGPIFAVLLILIPLQGATIFAYFAAKGCDILESGIIKNVNAVIPVAILELFKNQPGIAGLFTAALSSAALSSLSSSLSSLSAVTFEDILKVKFPKMKSDMHIKVSKSIVLMYGIVTMGLAFALSNMPGSVPSIFFSLMACVDGPMCSIFLLSIFCKRASTKGLLTGACCGMAITIWLNIGSKFTDVPTYPRLPAGPTDQCGKYSDHFQEGTNITDIIAQENISTPLPTSATTVLTNYTFNDQGDDVTFLQRIYSISYTLFSLIGLLTSLLVGFVVSVFTTPPRHLNKRCIFSFREHILGESREYRFNSGTTEGDMGDDVKHDKNEALRFLNIDEEL